MGVEQDIGSNSKYLKYTIIKITTDLKRKSYSRKVWWVESSFNNPSINSNDGKDHTSQEDKCKFIDIFNSHKNNYGHQGNGACSIDSHIVQHGLLNISLFFCFKNSSIRGNIFLQTKQILYSFNIQFPAYYIFITSVIHLESNWDIQVERCFGK